MIKLFLYIISLISILLILIYNPTNTPASFIGSNQVFNTNSNQEMVLRAIIINIILFFILTIVYVNLISS